MRRREFITLIGSAAAGWPFAARAQPTERIRRIGVLMPYLEDDPVARARVTVFLETLHQLGWTDGLNIRIDYRWSGGDADRIREAAVELVALAPDVILANGGVTVRPLQEASRTVPIIFADVIDPVGAGFVQSLARPGGNASGFTVFEYSLSGKWVELLKQIAPTVTRAAVLRNPLGVGAGGQFGAMQAVAPSFGVDLQPVDVRDTSEIERAVAEFAREPNGSLIVTFTPLTVSRRELIIELAARHRLPAIYPYSEFAAEGGLISYGPDPVDPFRRAASYVDRVLKGEQPGGLPVQAPTKYELVINLKTAKSLGMTVPQPLLATADQVIE
jgi:putative tryptophan/tyrosine transport system substrate-binding protein